MKLSARNQFQGTVTRITEGQAMAEVTVKDETLSAAIGKKGVNIKLASKLTQWDIQISNRKYEHLDEGQRKQ